MVRSRWLAAFSDRNVGSSISFLARLIAPEDRARPELARERHVLFLEDLLHQRLLVVGVVDDEPAVDADRLAVLAEDPGAERVERAGLDVAALLADQADDPLAELGRGAVGERDREDPPRGDPVHADEVRDPVGQHAGLARAGAGEDQQRSLGRRDRARLLRVERPDDLLDPFRAAGGDGRRIGGRDRDWTGRPRVPARPASRRAPPGGAGASSSAAKAVPTALGGLVGGGVGRASATGGTHPAIVGGAACAAPEGPARTGAAPGGRRRAG